MRTKGLYIILLALGVAALLVGPFRHIRREHQVKETLFAIQTALQNYHVKHEIYVEASPLSGGRLVRVLIEEGFLESPPRNPYTGKPFAMDGKETDRIVYRTSESLKTYSLQAMHFDRDEVFLELDSTKHQSFEE